MLGPLVLILYVIFITLYESGNVTIGGVEIQPSGWLYFNHRDSYISTMYLHAGISTPFRIYK